jgi:DNA mismatch repair ATPase MutL
VQYQNLYTHFIAENEQEYQQQQYKYNQQQQYNQYNQQQQYNQYNQYYQQQYNQYYQGQEEQTQYEEDEEQQNQNQQQQWEQWNTTGYASADLKLLSLEYTLFNFLPFNFCGDWVQQGRYNSNPCPYDGMYTFTIAYTLPWDDGDITTWFATGWQGVSDLVIYKNATESKNNELLASCTMHWKTYVTHADESEGWKTLPSAAQAVIIMVSILSCMLCCCTYLTFCRRQRRRRHVTDADYAPGEREETETSKTEFTLFDDEKTREQKQKRAKDEMIHKINLSLKEPDWV